MDCFELLKKDHDEVAQLMKKCQQAGADKKAMDIFKEIARNLAVHSKLEETRIYPKFRDDEELGDLVEEAFDEHQEIEETLEEMAQMSPSDEEWESKLQELKENIEHHVKEEESEFFPKAAKILGKDEASELGDMLIDEKMEMLAGKRPEAKEVFSRLGL